MTLLLAGLEQDTFLQLYVTNLKMKPKYVFRDNKFPPDIRL